MPPGAYCADAPTPSFHYLSFSDRQVPTWFRWRRSGRKTESDSGGDGLLANPRIVARRRFQPFGRRHRNRSGGFCCFSPPKSREREKSFFLVLLRPKVPKASARRSPRECASRGAARGAQDQAYAPPRGGRAAARPLFFRVKRECGFIVPPTAAFFILFGNAPRHSFPARRVPTWFRWRESGRRAESESGGDGLLANPRSRPTPLSAFRPPASESVGWLLLLFAIEKQLKKFFMYFWGQKYQKPPHVVFRGIARAAALHGARKIRPMRHPVADAPQLAPSFSASNESADLLCRQRRHFLFYLAMHPGILFPQGGSRLGSDGGKADEGLKARAAGTVCLQTRAVARRRFQPSGRRHRNRSGGFCCFSPSKSREKSFLCTFGAKSTKSLRTSFSAGVREPRRCTGRARSGLCATP